MTERDRGEEDSQNEVNRGEQCMGDQRYMGGVTAGARKHDTKRFKSQLRFRAKGRSWEYIKLASQFACRLQKQLFEHGESNNQRHFGK